MSVPEEPSAHVPGAGVREPEGRVGDQERETSSARHQVNENGETGMFLSGVYPAETKSVS